MCSLHLTHPNVHTWSSGQPTVQRPGSSRGLPVGAGIRTHNLGLPQVSSPTLYPLGQRRSRGDMAVGRHLTGIGREGKDSDVIVAGSAFTLPLELVVFACFATIGQSFGLA